MKPVLFAVAGAVASVLAFPPYGPGILIFVGLGLFLAGLHQVESRLTGLWIGLLYGVGFFGGLMWWLGELHWAALALVPVQALWFGLFGWWLAGYRDASGATWLLMAIGGWAVMELLRYRVPVGGTEWGAVGYALSDQGWVRWLAPTWGTSGITVMAVGVSALVVLEAARRSSMRSRLIIVVPVVAALLLGIPSLITREDRGPGMAVAIVQGSTPCPFDSCPPNQRLQTFEQHIALTSTIEPGSAGLVVWPESSAGSVNVDPVQNPEIGEQVADEARRIGAAIMLGTDRPVSATHWINANVVYGPTGEYLGEYRKQHPVPFGEYVPFRSFFTRLIDELYRVPRDMIPGEGPVLFELPGTEGSENPTYLGSVISWEGGFSRYSRAHARLGANLMVVATNNESYGPGAPTSDQFIGMTRMRAAELGLPVVHAAITGKSVFIDRTGEVLPGGTSIGSQEVIQAELQTGTASLYARSGDLLMVGFAVAAPIVWWRQRRLVTSTGDEEE